MTHFRHIRFVVLVQVFLMWCAVPAFGHYRPGTGRWLERDPLRYVDGSNLFEVLQGRPNGYMDPLGLDAGWAKRPYSDPYGERCCPDFKELELWVSFDHPNDLVDREWNWPPQVLIGVPNWDHLLLEADSQIKNNNTNTDMHCACIKRLVISAHGGKGQIESGDQTVGADALWRISANKPRGADEEHIARVFAALKETLCPGAIIEFFACHAGSDPRFGCKWLAIFGADKRIISYDHDVRFLDEARDLMQSNIIVSNCESCAKQESVNLPGPPAPQTAPEAVP